MFLLRQSRAIIFVYKGKVSTGLFVGFKVRRLCRFPKNLPLALLRAYLSGKPCFRPPYAKEAFANENNRSATIRPKREKYYGEFGMAGIETATTV